MIIVVASEKGGTGKTTIATNLAIINAQNGADVLLVDADPQKSSLDFASIRAEEGHKPQVTCSAIYGRGINAELKKLSTKFDSIIVDVGGRDSVTLRSALLVANTLVIPFSPSQYDIWGIQRMDDLIEEAMQFNEDINIITFLNKVDTNPKSNLTEQAINFTEEFKHLKFHNIQIGYRVAFRRSVADGLAVTELKNQKDNKAILEIQKLYNEVFKDA